MTSQPDEIRDLNEKAQKMVSEWAHQIYGNLEEKLQVAFQKGREQGAFECRRAKDIAHSEGVIKEKKLEWIAGSIDKAWESGFSAAREQAKGIAVETIWEWQRDSGKSTLQSLLENRIYAMKPDGEGKK